MVKNAFYQNDLVTLNNISINKVNHFLKTAQKFKKTHSNLLENKIIAHCFFEPSTRTRLSFETAALQLGAKNIGFAGTEGLSIQKGETVHDTLKIVSGYADLIVIRHPLEGSATLAADIAECPVINAGDGANQHPTQALLDLLTIHECQDQKINGLSIALAGDLKYGRTIHSLINLFSLFDIRLYLVSPESLALPEIYCNQLKKQGVRFSFHQSLKEVIDKIDILYMTRIQQERFMPSEYSFVKEPFILSEKLLSNAKLKSNFKILHPLPRLNEIPMEIDRSPYAYYFQQAQNGLVARKALLAMTLCEDV